MTISLDKTPETTCEELRAQVESLRAQLGRAEQAHLSSVNRESTLALELRSVREGVATVVADYLEGIEVRGDELWAELEEHEIRRPAVQRTIYATIRVAIDVTSYVGEVDADMVQEYLSVNLDDVVTPDDERVMTVEAVDFRGHIALEGVSITS